MKNIEVELRSFIKKTQYDKLIKFFEQQAKFVGSEKQITYYFSGQNDLRIQKSNDYAKIWLKKGKLHDEAREEIEIKFKREDFDLIYKLFINLGFAKEIEWRRRRRTYHWQGIDVMVDYTEGYGYIIEMEKIAGKTNMKKALNLLTEKFKELGIVITPKKEFDKKFSYYKKNWRRILNE